MSARGVGLALAMNAPGLPPPDRIALALWRSGAVHAAIELSRAAIARGDARWMVCKIAIDRMERGENPDDEGGELPALDLALVGAMLERGRWVEALWVLRGAPIEDPGARGLTSALEQALAPFPAEADPAFGAVHKLVRAGQAQSALRALEEILRQTPSPPPWLVARHRVLAWVARGHWREAEPLEPITRETVLGRIRARDLPAALDAARAAGAAELTAILARLLTATERVFADSIPDTDDPETIPIQGHRLAELNIRMGVLPTAERTYRSILRETPGDERARAMLTDVVALRRALGDTPEPLPPRAASVGFLKKNAPRVVHDRAWSSGRGATWEGERDEVSTANLDVGQEAELLLSLGRAEQALDLYRLLAIRHPMQQAYRKRILEIEALIARRMTPVAGEVTIRQSPSQLQLEATPRPVRSQPASFDDEEPATMVDRLPRRED